MSRPMNRPFLLHAIVLGLSIARTVSGQPAGEAAGRLGQTIRFDPLPEVVYLDPDLELRASASSGLPVSFTATGDCTVTAAMLRFLSAGQCRVTASQPGDARWSPAPDVEQRLSIGKAGQVIRFPEQRPRVFLDPDFELGVSASSGLPVVLIASGPCEVSGSSVRILAAGRCSVSAHQPGDSSFTAARIVEREFPIARAQQSIDLEPVPDPLRDEVVLRAASSAGLPVRFTAEGACAVSGASLRPLRSGACTVSAHQPGNGNIEPAPTRTQTVRVIVPERRRPDSP